MAERGAKIIMTVASKSATKKARSYFALTEEHSDRDQARAVIIPVPYEATTTYIKGTGKGPDAIMQASEQVELFDDELWVEPYKIGIATDSPIEISAPARGKDKGQEEAELPFAAITTALKPLIEKEKFPILVGGEQSIAIGAVRACLDKYPDLSILHIDAHADLRAIHEGDPYSHACVAHQLYHMLPTPGMVQAGVRNVSWDEVAWMETEQPKVDIFWARNQEQWDVNEMINLLSPNVYLSIDLSAIDSAIMPATGNPEPGGLTWYKLLEILRVLCVKRNVVAADITELSPIDGMVAPEFMAAKLLYKLIGYRFALDLGVSKKYV